MLIDLKDLIDKIDRIDKEFNQFLINFDKMRRNQEMIMNRQLIIFNSLKDKDLIKEFIKGNFK